MAQAKTKKAPKAPKVEKEEVKEVAPKKEVKESTPQLAPQIRLKLYRGILVEGVTSPQLARGNDGKILNKFSTVSLTVDSLEYNNYIEQLKNSNEYFKAEVIEYYDGKSQKVFENGSYRFTRIKSEIPKEVVEFFDNIFVKESKPMTELELLKQQNEALVKRLEKLESK